MPGEAGFEELAHRRAVGLAVAQVEVGVEGDEAVVRKVGAAQRAQGVPGSRVVPAEQDDQLEAVVKSRDCVADPLGAAGSVGLADVAVVDDAHRVGQVGPVAEGPGGEALESTSDGGRGARR